jgi:hypothetical protein
MFNPYIKCDQNPRDQVSIERAGKTVASLKRDEKTPIDRLRPKKVRIVAENA